MAPPACADPSVWFFIAQSHPLTLLDEECETVHRAILCSEQSESGLTAQH